MPNVGDLVTEFTGDASGIRRASDEAKEAVEEVRDKTEEAGDETERTEQRSSGALDSLRSGWGAVLATLLLVKQNT